MFSFDKVFKPSEEEKEQQRKRLQEIEAQAKAFRPERLVCHHCSPTYVAEPFTSFYGDCTFCKHYVDSNQGFVTGGYCKQRNYAGCGYGFTCRDFEGEQEAMERVQELFDQNNL